MSNNEDRLDLNQDYQYLAANKVAKIINKSGHDAYIIGGAVRDLLLGLPPKDFDVVTSATPQEIANLPGIKKSNIEDAAHKFGITRAVVNVQDKAIPIEIATFREDIEAHLGRKQTKIKFASLEDDVLRRDLTINALALDLNTMQVIDFVGGLKDLLDQKLIRFIGDPTKRIKEDPLRILRAIRLKNQLGFRYDKSTQKAIKLAIESKLLTRVSNERIRDELTKMLVHPSRVEALQDLDYFGIISQVLPELASTKNVPQPKQYHQEGDVWTHTLLAISALPKNVSARLVWATLLHDVGKPPTYLGIEQTGDRIRFNDHARVGSKLARDILTRLRFPKQFVNDVAWMIEYHLGIDDLPRMRPGKQYNILSHPAFSDLLQLHRADALAAWRLSPDGTAEITEPDFSHLEKIWEEFQQRKTKEKKEPSLKRDLGIDGNWLINNFSLRPGKEVGWVLKKLNKAYLDKDIQSEDDARKVVFSLLRKH